MKIAILILTAGLLFAAQRKQGDPTTALPRNAEILTHFGERADFSPDNQRIAFMNKSFGDAFVIDLKTKVIRCLTCSVPGAAFLRVMHLASGDYLLIGPERFSDIRTSRARDNELWFLSKKTGSKPVRFNQKMSEGAAVSKKNMRISFSETPAQFPDMPREQSRLVVADVNLSGATPKLTNRKVVYESKSTDCRIESQDFYDNDTKMTYTCYEPKGLASVWSIDLKTGNRAKETVAPGAYNEVEGIFPDGKYTCVEADKQTETLGGDRGMRNIDIWKLRLGSQGKDFVRLTNFNDYEGWKASNPVISTDGKTMAFQIARTADEAGVGYGIVLMKLP
jgi:hypothetical protein